jgi:hypothetical protein
MFKPQLEYLSVSYCSNITKGARIEAIATSPKQKYSSDSGIEGHRILGQTKIGPPKISAHNGKKVRSPSLSEKTIQFQGIRISHHLLNRTFCLMKPRVLVLSLLIRQMLSTIILVIGNHLFPALSMSILVSQANALVVMIAEKKTLTTITVTTITQEKEREGQKE